MPGAAACTDAHPLSCILFLLTCAVECRSRLPMRLSRLIGSVPSAWMTSCVKTLQSSSGVSTRTAVCVRSPRLLPPLSCLQPRCTVLQSYHSRCNESLESALVLEKRTSSCSSCAPSRSTFIPEVAVHPFLKLLPVRAVNCILKWAAMRPAVSCPTCKAPFSNLLVHRQLDGSLTDFQVEESAALLVRTPWFREWAEVCPLALQLLSPLGD